MQLETCKCIPHCLINIKQNLCMLIHLTDSNTLLFFKLNSLVMLQKLIDLFNFFHSDFEITNTTRWCEYSIEYIIYEKICVSLFWSEITEANQNKLKIRQIFMAWLCIPLSAQILKLAKRQSFKLACLNIRLNFQRTTLFTLFS